METTLIKVSYNMWVQDFSMGKERRLRGMDTQLIPTVYQFCEISTVITVFLFNNRGKSSMETTVIKVSYNMWVQDFLLGKECRLRGTDTQLISTVYQFCEISTVITVFLFNCLFFNMTTLLSPT